ncbi:transcription antiterminator BglG [Streptococcus macedonicus]|nr:transcription antiterminator BglG [Streptococcus macedonicus]
MNKKQLQFDRLLAVLHQNSDYITAKSLSKQLNLSEKTVYRLVKEINQNYFPDELIIKKRGRGFKLNRLKNYATLINSKQNDFTPASRQLQIFERLLTISPKKLLIYDLAQEYYVSDSVIMKDKIEIQKRLNPFHLKISTRTGYIFITGSELDIRRALADLVPTFSMIDIDNLSNTSNKSHFDLELAKIILKEFDQIETDLQARLPYPYNVNIFSHLYIMLERLKISSRKIPNAEVVDIKMTDYDDLILKESKKIINDIGNRLGRSIDDLEINYLYQYLYSSRFQLSTHQQKIEFSTRFVFVTKFYFKKMEMTKSESINEQSPMFIDLANHISPFVGRLEDIGTDAYQLISDLREIIAASIRNTVHVENVAKRGTHIATIPDAFLIK